MVHRHACGRCIDSRFQVCLKYKEILHSLLQYSGLLWKVFANLISKGNDRARAVEMLCSEGLLRFDM